MDFSLTEEQLAVQDLARRILEDQAQPERLAEVEAGQNWFDERLWAELARANLLGIALPEDVGGSGLGLLELCLLLEQVGRAVAPIPVVPTLAMAAPVIAAFGTPEQRRSILPAVVTGEAMLTAALIEPGADNPLSVDTRATPHRTGWRLEGQKTCVPAAHLATWIIVPACKDSGETALFLVGPDDPGLSLTRNVATSGEPQYTLDLDGVHLSHDRVIPGEAILEWLVERATVALCAVELGVVDRALEMTAAYTSNRHQFERPLATFQAVAHRSADCYIDVLALRWTMWNAAWRLAMGLPATEQVAVAKFWAADAGHRVVSAAQHLHGGVGVDLSYPLHRYFLWSKQIELTLGSAPRQLLRIGEALAAR